MLTKICVYNAKSSFTTILLPLLPEVLFVPSMSQLNREKPNKTHPLLANLVICLYCILPFDTFPSQILPAL